MKRITPSLLLLFIVVIAYRFHNLYFPPPSQRSPEIIDSLSYYHGTSYVSILENEYDVSLLNQELSSPHQVTMTPDNKYVLVTQQTGEIFAFSKLGGSGFSSQPNLVTLLTTQEPPTISFSSNYTQDHRAYFTDGTNTWISTLSESNHRLYASIPLRLSTPPTDIFVFPPINYQINPDSGEVLFNSTPIIHRHKDAVGKISDLTSITVDPTTYHFFFTDSDEGRLYEGKLKDQ